MRDDDVGTPVSSLATGENSASPDPRQFVHACPQSLITQTRAQGLVDTQESNSGVNRVCTSTKGLDS